MTLHVYGAFLTHHGTAANNRGLTEGNTTTLQKLVWNGRVHTTVSAESIRFALRRLLAEQETCNRSWNETERVNEWSDASFSRWEGKSKEAPFVDDDLLGFMQAEGAKQEGERGTAKVRRTVLEVNRAVSLTPWSGDVTFNAASPGATPSAQKKGSNPVPYATEMHATRYQYGIAMTPQRLRKPERGKAALRALCCLGEVAGNHGRFLYDFSPESVVFRITQDPAPRILYVYGIREDGSIHADDLVRKVKAKDIDGKELVIGGHITGAIEELKAQGASLLDGVMTAWQMASEKLP